MKKEEITVVGLAFAGAAVFAVVRGDAAEEVKRLAELMGWKRGRLRRILERGREIPFAADERVGVSGKVYATEIDRKSWRELRSEVAKRSWGNVIVAGESKSGDDCRRRAAMRFF